MGFEKLQLRRGTEDQWAEANPVLLAGEPAFETDTGLLKVGDGVTAYADLDGISGGGGGGQLDGGTAFSIYGGTTAIDGGAANTEF